MDGHYLEDLPSLERRIDAMMAEQALPPAVVGYDVEFGEYMDGGDPAVWINLHIPGKSEIDWAEAKVIGKLLIDLRLKLVPLAPSRLALVAMKRPPANQPLEARAHA